MKKKEKQRQIKTKRHEKWTFQQDSNLKSLKQLCPESQWKDISQMMIEFFQISRTAKQCRQRWIHHLKGQKKNIIRWASEQSQRLLEIHDNYGSSWIQIIKHFPNRQQTQVKNLFYSIIRKSLRHMCHFAGIKTSTIKIGKIKPITLSKVLIFGLNPEFSLPGDTQLHITQAIKSLDLLNICRMIIFFIKNANIRKQKIYKEYINIRDVNRSIKELNIFNDIVNQNFTLFNVEINSMNKMSKVDVPYHGITNKQLKKILEFSNILESQAVSPCQSISEEQGQLESSSEQSNGKIQFLSQQMYSQQVLLQKIVSKRDVEQIQQKKQYNFEQKINKKHEKMSEIFIFEQNQTNLNHETLTLDEILKSNLLEKFISQTQMKDNDPSLTRDKYLLINTQQSQYLERQFNINLISSLSSLFLGQQEEEHFMLLVQCQCKRNQGFRRIMEKRLDCMEIQE